MTHEIIDYRKFFKSDFLQSSDLEGKDRILIIKEVIKQECTLTTGKEIHPVAYFTESTVKPMIINKGNCDILRRFCKNSYNILDWKDVAVTIYVKDGIKVGNDVRQGLRIRPIQPKIDKPILLKSSENYTKVVAALESGINIQKVIDKYNIEDTLFNELKTIVKK